MVTPAFGRQIDMKRRTWILGAALILFDMALQWSSWHARDWVTCVVMGIWAILLVGVIVNLAACRGQWSFRIPAFAVVGPYIAWHGWTWWQFLTKVD